MNLLEILSYGFIQRALLAGTLIALLCSVLGVFLVLRRLSLIGDGLAHVTFGSTAIALALHIYSAMSLLVSAPIVMLASLGILKLSEKGRLSGDAAIGLVSALGISVGIILASVGGGYNVDLLSYLFGNILSIRSEEVVVAGLLCLGVMLLLTLHYQELFAISFSDELAKVSGIRTSYINSILVVLTALSVVLAMKLVGIMLISSMLIVPAAGALQLARGFKVCILLAAIQGCCSVVIGIIISIMSNLPASATIVMVNLLIFAAACVARRIIYPKNSN
ncbi:MAG: metal ABC transporter permease [Deltaproteobacteria bacterium]|jgi:zinc transport system permease protein|nr:metal ABC transporter permease [Deltaproteobacteria bacterium]